MSAVNMRTAVRTIGEWIRQNQHHYVCVRDVHGIMVGLREPDLQRIHNRAGMVTPDGMPLVCVSRLMGRKQVKRVYGPDLMLEVCDASVREGWSHFFYGGAPGVAQQLAESLQQRFAGLRVTGVFSPPRNVSTRVRHLHSEFKLP